MSDEIVLVPYDPRWPSMHEAEAARLRAACGDRLLAIHHVGSTSVPGLASKPVIDIQCVVRSVGDADDLVPAVMSLGYERIAKWDEDLPRRRFFVRCGADGRRTHHLHVVEAGFWIGEEHLLFRDHLRRHPDAVRRYAELKRDLAARYAGNREHYTQAKSEFVGETLASARAGAPPGTPLGHVIVVGGSGMLAAASLGLAARGFSVSVVARKLSKLDRLASAARDAGGRLRPVSVDYRDAAALAFALDEASRAFGPVALVVVWTHSSAPQAPLDVARHAAKFGRAFEFFHVLGSAAADPSCPDDGRIARFAAVPRLAYREVILGFVRERGRSRWLTDDEISAGVLGAVTSHAPRTVVGVVAPWSQRP